MMLILGGPGTSAHGRHLFAVRTIQTGTLAAGQAAHQRELPTMVNHVKQDVIPHDVANGHWPAEKLNRLIEIRRCELADSSNRFAVNLLISRSELGDRARTFDVGWFGTRHVELPLIDPTADVRVALRQVPRQFAERSASGV